MAESSSCPECGAPAGKCEQRYHECLVKEFEDVDYGVVHHLTVATYMLQHSSKLTPEGWLFERDLLQEFLVENKPPVLIRKQNKFNLDSGRRTFKITSLDGKPKVRRTTWTKTILDVRMEDAAAYCKDVEAWARAVLEDAKDLSVQTNT